MRKLIPEEKIIGVDGLTLGGFWSWAYSDVLSNTIRPLLAEFLVGAALGVTDKPRVEWDAIDLRYRDKKIEVKSAAYVQSWRQVRPSRIVFDIGKKEGWDAEINRRLINPERYSDCYVFSLFTDLDRTNANVLNVAHWQFYVVPTELVNQTFGNQKSAALSRIQHLCDPVGYPQLKERIDCVLILTA